MNFEHPTSNVQLRISSGVRPLLILLFLCIPLYFSLSDDLEGKNLRFGIVTDPHYADTDSKGSRFYRESLEKMRECVGKMNEEKVDFLVELGDFKDQCQPVSEDTTVANLKSIESEFAKFSGPRYHVLGNHDVDSISKKIFLENVENTGIAKDKTYYSFIVKGFQFIVLDANFKKDGTPYDHGNFDWRDANIPAEEMEWLRRTISDHGGKSIIFIHQRLDDDKAEECVKNAGEVRKILSGSGKVLAVFSGHDHKGGLKKIDGISYCTLKAMIEKSGPVNSSYAIAEVGKDFSIKVSGFRRAESVEME